MGYVAMKRLRVGVEDRMPGDPVPEAAEWPNLKRLLSIGSLVWDGEGEIIPSLPSGVAPPGAARPEPEPVVETVDNLPFDPGEVNAEEAIELASMVATVEEAQAAVAAEASGKNRKTVTEALEKRIAELGG